MLLLRAVFGTMGGFSNCAVALMAIETPKAHVGKALGTLQTGQVTGQLLGPLLGGVMAEWIGMRNSFFFTGFFILVATLLVLFGVHETKKYPKFEFRVWKESLLADRRDHAKVPGKTQLRDVMKQTPAILTLFVSSFLIAASFQSISPVITLYVKSLHVEHHVEIIAGLIFASSALGTMIAAPILGRLGDRHGHLTILLCSLLLISVLYLPQARITDPWILMGARFLTGLCVGGLIPSISSSLRGLTPVSIQGSVFSYNTSANSLGNVIGSLFGGIVAGNLGIPILFYIISGVFLLHFAMLAVQAKKINEARKSLGSAAAGLNQ
ncbi:MFS transporter [Paenibacillus sp. P26]|nr:MFS transporter [Paenibacillus sp. P26]